ncbi:alpha/beta hydrolase [Patiriisocius marinistellae]|uniref:Alpha/beta hydrolase n=1 Tax=Patiriisocius marinistellae TaxID=2494560 RepID=A0A5J4FUK0_9FLAO|nr:alpha/beta hydrolase [Patiriisocius marinistellae]GEQ84684.1 alpha/beta hydrolase [Patiriisocius marinistellae]
MNLPYNNASIFYEIQGTGPALILLHGFLESSSIWNSTVEEFKKTHTIITVDLPGHGKSDVVAKTHEMELMAIIISEILINHNINTASFIGHSMGGYVALAFTELFPNKVRKLILLNSSTYSDSEDRKKNRDRAIKFIKKQKSAIISMAISNLFTQENRVMFASEILNLKNEALNFPSEGIIANIKGMRDRKDRTSVLKNFGGSKLIITGKMDMIVPISVSEEISEATNTPLKTINGGHMSWITNRKEMLNAMRFID